MDQTLPYQNYLIDAVKEKSIKVTEEFGEAEKRYEKAQKEKKGWDDLLMYLLKNWPCHIIQSINQDKYILIGDKIASKETASIIDEIYQTARTQAEILQKRYPAYIEEACRDNNLIIDRGSRHPKYNFFGGFFRLEIDDRNYIARLSDYEGKLAEFPADVGAAIEIIQREYTRVLDRPFDGNMFIRMLRNQYLAIVKRDNLTDGAEIPIRKITHRLGKNIEGFRRDEFLVDLSRLAEKGPTEIDGRRLYLQHTKDINQGMLLYTKRGGYIGYVVFKKE